MEVSKLHAALLAVNLILDGQHNCLKAAPPLPFAIKSANIEGQVNIPLFINIHLDCLDTFYTGSRNVGCNDDCSFNEAYDHC